MVWRRLFAAATAPLLVAVPLLAIDAERLLAQSPAADPTSFPLPTALPDGSTIRVDGSSSMSTINAALKQRFEQQFAGTTVELADAGTDAALQALIDGDIDLAAVGRPLTDAERAQDLVEVPISREKIAIIVGPDNPFQGSLTFEQFARMFRGEITDWSEVGGAPGPIRFIDRPESSDTRRALSQYGVFQTAPFANGSNTTRVAEDDTAAVVAELGSDGISYAIASQVLDQANVRALPMHNTLPDDPRYPFSQPRSYVYSGEPSPAVQAFLGFATSAPGQEIVEDAKAQEAEAVAEGEPVTAAPASPEAAAPSPEAQPEASPAPVAAAEFDKSRLWWLLLPLLGLPLLLWLLRGRGAAVPPVAADDRRLILTPRTCRDAYAYWEVPEADLRQHGRDLKLRLYDVTDIDLDRQQPHSVKQFDCDDRQQDLHVPIALDDRDYLAELGYLHDGGRWQPLVRSSHVRVPACPEPRSHAVSAARVSSSVTSADVGRPAVAPEQRVTNAVTAGAAAIGSAAAGLGAASLRNRPEADRDNRIILVPRTADAAYVYWEVTEDAKAALKRQGGRDLRLRIYDATNLDINHQTAHSVQEYSCDEQARDYHVVIPTSDRDYIADLGYVTDNSGWLSLARSLHTRVSSQRLTR